MLRSETHRLVLTGVAGLALVLASQAMMNAYEGAKSVREAALSVNALSIPFTLTFLLIVGLRLVFEIPVELSANWVFRLLVDADRQESEPLARKVILVAVLPWIAATTFGLYAYLKGPMVAALHTLLVVVWTVLLTNIVLVRFRKLPFTCSMPVFQQHSIVILIAFCFGFLIYVGSTAEFEASALREPLRMLELLPVAALAWFIPRHLKSTTIDLEKRIIFEESAARSFELLRLGE